MNIHEKLVQTTTFSRLQMSIQYDECNNTYEYDLTSNIKYSFGLDSSQLTTYEFYEI